jgi:hypothetical protein
MTLLLAFALKRIILMRAGKVSTVITKATLLADRF